MNNSLKVEFGTKNTTDHERRDRLMLWVITEVGF